MAPQRHPQHEMPTHLPHPQIPLHNIHQPPRIRRHPANRPHHINSMHLIPRPPRIIRPLGNLPRPVIPLVERQRDEAPPRRPARGRRPPLVPRADGPRRDVGHVGARLLARVVQPEAGDLRGGLRGGELVEAVDVDEEPRHWDRLHGDVGRGREGVRCAFHGCFFGCARLDG